MIQSNINNYIQEIITSTKNDDKIYINQCQELIDYLQNLPSDKETPEIQYLVILLNFCLGNYTLVGLSFNLLCKPTIEILGNIIRKYDISVMPNLYSEFDSLASTKEKVNSYIIEIIKKNYQERQIEFICKFYKKIFIKNLQDMFPPKDIDKIIAKMNWQKEKDKVIINEKNLSSEFSVDKNINDIKKLNENNIKLNELIKNHKKIIDQLLQE